MGVASKLDRIVTFHRATLVDDGLSMSEVWAPHGGPTWALREDVKDGEKFRAGEVQATLTARFQVRSTDFTRGITPRDRLTCEGVAFAIIGAKEASQYGRRQLIEITCAGRIDG